MIDMNTQQMTSRWQPLQPNPHEEKTNHTTRRCAPGWKKRESTSRTSDVRKCPDGCTSRTGGGGKVVVDVEVVVPVVVVFHVVVDVVVVAVLVVVLIRVAVLDVDMYVVVVATVLVRFIRAPSVVPSVPSKWS